MFRKFHKSLLSVVLLAGAALSLLPAQAFAAFAFVASHQVNSSNSATTTLTLTISAGQELIILAADGANSGATLTVTDTRGNTFISRKTINDTFDQESYALIDCLTPAAGADTITLTTTGATTPEPGLQVLVYTGLASFDQATSKFAHSGWATTTNGATSTAISPASQPGMLLGFASGVGGTIAPDAGASTRVNDTTWINAQNTVIEDYRFTSTASETANFTFSLATASNVIIAGTYIETSGAGAPFAPIPINMGSGPNTGTGDSLDVAFPKINTMMGQLFPNRSTQTPVTGFTLTPAQSVTELILNPAGTLASGTVTLPPNPGDGQIFEIMSSQTITAFAVNTSDGTTINGAPTTLSNTSAVTWIFIASLNAWFRAPPR
jgi:hypothetical protein